MGGSSSTLSNQSVSPETAATLSNQIVLVTGANSGLGYEACRQLGLSGWGKVILGCRNKERGEEAMKKLKETTSKDVFELVIVDSENQASCIEAAKSLSGKLNCVILNAGRPLAKDSALKVTDSGSCANVAMHSGGPATFIEAAMSSGKLADNATVIYVSSEAARGIKPMGLAQVNLPKDAGGLDKLIRGEWRTKSGGESDEWDTMSEYGAMKLLGTLYFYSFARKNPKLTVFSVSPGIPSVEHAP